ncbi:MAG: 4-hydroxythreonine-4-phosphate dehydrogenase PdxA [Gammaproteobacteria bacterium]|nr:MAG: 4-hydroxythreonine-4-phosphate dehydrogenase PdxA [Gammaproteobacteria bacterium]
MANRAATPVAITCGDPAGIGPDIILKYFSENPEKTEDCVVIGDISMFEERTGQLGLDLDITPHVHDMDQSGNGLKVVPVACAKRVMPGAPDPGNANYILSCLDAAIDGCLRGTYSAMVTAPISKAVINQAGIPFTGHTEYLADKLNVELPVMMLAAGSFRVVLATTHLPLRDVPDAITQDRVERCISILIRSLKSDFMITDPKIRVCGLNPHAGDGGYLGKEDMEKILPAIEKAGRKGFCVEGPLSADTIFSRENMKTTDAFLAMFHDQGLPVLKYAGFGEAINITLGLPIIRTSVDHGTAFDLAGTGQASEKSLGMAICQAEILARNRSRHAN